MKINIFLGWTSKSNIWSYFDVRNIESSYLGKVKTPNEMNVWKNIAYKGHFLSIKLTREIIGLNYWSENELKGVLRKMSDIYCNWYVPRYVSTNGSAGKLVEKNHTTFLYFQIKVACMFCVIKLRLFTVKTQPTFSPAWPILPLFCVC